MFKDSTTTFPGVCYPKKLRENAKNPSATSQTLQASASMYNVKFHDRTNSKRRDETKVEPFPHDALQHVCQHGGGGVRICACFADTGP